MTNPQQNALAEALERIARSKYGLQNIQEDHGHDTNAYNFHAMKYYQRLAHEYEQTARQALASNNPAAVEGQGEADGLRDTFIVTLKAAGGLHNPEINAPFIADALLAVLAPAPGQWDNSYHSERTDAVLARMSLQHTELASEAIEVICLLRHEQDRLRNENLTLGARVLELEGADREVV